MDVALQVDFAGLASLVVSIVILIISLKHERSLERMRSAAAQDVENLRARLTNQCGYYQHKLDAHEELWKHIASCSRAQENLARLVEKPPDGVTDLAAARQEAAKKIAEERNIMKNLVYDKGIYFDDDTVRAVRQLAEKLADPGILHVAVDVKSLEDIILSQVKKYT